VKSVSDRANCISQQLLDMCEECTPAIWPIVVRTQGSAPRDAGASMIVTAKTTVGTIGGGHLELKSIAQARAMLNVKTDVATQRHFPLGPALGQCCGGAVSVLFVPVVESMCDELLRLQRVENYGGPFEVNRVIDTGETVSAMLNFTPWRVWVFGAGHVGKAIVEAMSALPCRITWVDERDAEFPEHIPSNVEVLASPAPADEVRHIPAGAQVLVLTHSHALDLEICFALLKRDDLSYCGLIGSATKAATFRKRFSERGITDVQSSRIMCPIGRHEIRSKHPSVIAVGVAADLACKNELFYKNAILQRLKPQNVVF
jgi:xanthine dehydrogenase accessory factor